MSTWKKTFKQAKHKLGKLLLGGMCSGCKCCIHKHACGKQQEERETSLDQLKAGETGTIVHMSIDSHHSLKRMYERGLKPGASITLLKSSSLNGPLLLSINGRMVAIRPDEASLFTINTSH